MSRRHRAGFSEGKGAVPVDRSLKAFFAGRLLDHVDMTSEDLRKALRKMFHAPEVIKSAFGKIPTQPDCDIAIGSGPGARLQHLSERQSLCEDVLLQDAVDYTQL